MQVGRPLTILPICVCVLGVAAAALPVRAATTELVWITVVDRDGVPLPRASVGYRVDQGGMAKATPAGHAKWSIKGVNGKLALQVTDRLAGSALIETTIPPVNELSILVYLDGDTARLEFSSDRPRAGILDNDRPTLRGKPVASNSTQQSSDRAAAGKRPVRDPALGLNAPAHRQGPPACGSGGDCCTVTLGTPGCMDVACCQAVCAADSFCCDVEWDGLCVGAAESLCPGCAPPPCDIICDPGKTLENEANCGLPTDTVNGGCNSTPPVFSPIVCGQSYCGSGAFDGATRDTDWYKVTVTAAAPYVTWTVSADFDLLIGIVNNFGVDSCAGVTSFLVFGTGGPCEVVTVSACLTPGVWYLFVAPDFTNAVTCPALYNASLTCGPCPTGACCLSNGTCLPGLSAPACAAQGGIYQGDGSTCTPGLCPVGPGNDTCQTAETLSIPDTALGSTVLATNEPAPFCVTSVDTAPSVWYHVVGNGNTLTASLCNLGTTYDTKIHVYCDSCDNLACVTGDDDFCGFPPGYSQVSWCSAMGTNYYIRVSGFGASSGSFELTLADGPSCSDPVSCVISCGSGIGDCCAVHPETGCDDPTCCQAVCGIDPFCCNVTWDGICVGEAEDLCPACAPAPCDIICDPGKTPENEPNCGLPADFVNGGCNSTPPIFSPIVCGQSYCGSGAFDGGTRDTDWYQVVVGVDTEFTWTVTADFDALIGMVETSPLGTPDCATATALDPFATGDPCDVLSVTRCVPPGTYWWFVAPQFTDIVPCPALYNATLTCVGCVPPEPPANDTCLTAETLSIPDTATGSTDLAGPDAAPFCDFSVTAPGVWYHVVGNGNTLTASLCNPGTNYDTKIHVYCDDCAELACVVGDDDACGFPPGYSQVSWCSGLGTNYYILVSGFGGSTGDFELTLADGPSCSDPVSCVATCGSGIGDCCVAHPETGCNDISCCQAVCAIDSFCCEVEWDSICAGEAEDLCPACAPQPCDITCDPGKTLENEPNCGLPTDTVNGGCNSTPPVFSPIVCGQSYCGTSAYDGATRDTDWYRLTVAPGGQSVTWTVSADFDLLMGIVDTGGVDDCAGVTDFLVFATAGPCVQTSVQACLPGGVWYLFVAPQFTDIVPCGALYNATVTCGPCLPGACCLSNGTCVPDLTAAACAAQGGTYQGDGSTCTPGLCPVGPGNDACVNATLLTVPSSTSGSTVGATIDSGFPTCGTAGTPTAPGLWYRVTGTGNTITASLCNPGTNYDSKLSVYCPSCAAPQCIAGDDDFCGFPPGYSQVSWCSQLNGNYLILVHGFGASVGNFTLTLSQDAVVCVPSVVCTPIVPTGGCCVFPGCTIQTEADCLAGGGQYLGDGTNCDVAGTNYVDVNSPPLAIPDSPAPGVSDTLIVNDSFIISDLNVDLVINHTWVGDLRVTLTHGADVVMLIDQPGVPATTFGCDQNNYNIILDDEGAGGPIETLCSASMVSPPNYVPNNPLSAFDGDNVNGAWVLTVSDHAGADVGTLVQWSLHLPGSGSPCVFDGACCNRLTGVCVDDLLESDCQDPGEEWYQGETCDEISPPCAVCGNGIVEATEECDGGACCDSDCTYSAPGTACGNFAGGGCDVAETCTGSSALCPPNVVRPAGFVCRPDNGGGCDVAETCDGTAKVCPPDSARPIGFVCRASAGVCDPAEFCTGSSGPCPANVFSPNTTVCNPSTGVCDPAENCTGSGPACPSDVMITACIHDDDCCPPGCTNLNDSDCPITEPTCTCGEICDAPNPADVVLIDNLDDLDGEGKEPDLIIMASSAGADDPGGAMRCGNLSLKTHFPNALFEREVLSVQDAGDAIRDAFMGTRLNVLLLGHGGSGEFCFSVGNCLNKQTMGILVDKVGADKVKDMTFVSCSVASDPNGQAFMGQLRIALGADFIKAFRNTVYCLPEPGGGFGFYVAPGAKKVVPCRDGNGRSIDLCANDDGCCPTGCTEANDNDCEPSSIPTVSEWGLVIMTLLLLAVGKVYFGHRRPVLAGTDG